MRSDPRWLGLRAQLQGAYEKALLRSLAPKLKLPPRERPPVPPLPTLSRRSFSSESGASTPLPPSHSPAGLPPRPRPPLRSDQRELRAGQTERIEQMEGRSSPKERRSHLESRRSQQMDPGKLLASFGGLLAAEGGRVGRQSATLTQEQLSQLALADLEVFPTPLPLPPPPLPPPSPLAPPTTLHSVNRIDTIQHALASTPF